MDLPARTYSENIRQVRIDISTLNDFGTFVRAQLDNNISPMSDRVSHALVAGGDIGPNLPSDDLQLMNMQHSVCVTAMCDQLEAFKAGMAIIAAAAHTIAARYSTSDALAHTTIDNIAPAISTAANNPIPTASRS